MLPVDRSAAASPDMLQIVPAGRNLRDTALTLLYNRLPASERRQQVAEMRRAVDAGEIPLDDLLVEAEPRGCMTEEVAEGSSTVAGSPIGFKTRTNPHEFKLYVVSPPGLEPRTR